MKLAASNIAWERHDDPSILALLRHRGITGIEVAPTRVWPGWAGATPAAAAAYRRHLADEGFECPALQAVLFDRSGLALFGSPAECQALVRHLARVAELADALGAPVVVLGAPKVRDRAALAPDEAMEQAAELLREVGKVYASQGVRLCIEPNPTVYGCNFVTTSGEGAALVARCMSAGVGLHLDAAGMHLAGEEPAEAVRGLAGRFAHFHASEPQLGRFDTPVVDHAAVGQALRGACYGGWVSLEMRPQPDEAAALDAACAVLAACYGEHAQ